uniref:Bulb-type lectin domain-containing protein n=1 Tax=Salix viminalis TaxID=40686 RepID=A0A6N2MZE1_SALVM
MGRFFVILVCCFLLFTLTNSSTPAMINPSQSIRDGETLLSDGGSFELGFFNPGNSTNRYLGLWHTKSPKTVLWVANRDTPFSDRLGVLTITREGVLVLLRSPNDTVWSSNPSRTAENPVAEVLDYGNLVVREENDSNPENFLWQSFDHPCDTLMLGMKLGSNFVTKTDQFLSSWRSAEDPAPGEYSFLIDTHGYPQLLLKRGNKTLFRGGSWNGINFVSDPRPLPISNEFVFNSKEVYFKFEIQSSFRVRQTLSPSGLLQSYIWSDRTNDWVITDAGQPDQCDDYAICGPNTRCEINRSPICVCLDGFVPKSPADLNFSDWSGGCIRRTPLECSDKVGFLKYTGMKLPDTSSSWYDKSISIKECKGLCSKNCSCNAYANLDIRDGGSGCLIWFGELIDIRKSTGDGQDLYVRMNATELAMLKRKRTFSKKKLAGIVSSAIGILIGGQQIAVKRLSKSSGQGLDEFKNEVMLIAKLQHRNLVKLLGCCVHEDERMLIYEYMPNKSLDFFIFGANPSEIIRLKFSFIYVFSVTNLIC